MATTQSDSCYQDATCPSAFQLGGGIKSTINASSIFLPNGERPRPARRLLSTTAASMAASPLPHAVDASPRETRAPLRRRNAPVPRRPRRTEDGHYYYVLARCPDEHRVRRRRVRALRAPRGPVRDAGLRPDIYVQCDHRSAAPGNAMPGPDQRHCQPGSPALVARSAEIKPWRRPIVSSIKPQVTRRGRRGPRRRRRARVLQPPGHVHRRRRRASGARDESHRQSRERGAGGPGPGRGRVARPAAQRRRQSLQRLVERRSRRSAGRQRFVSRRRNRPRPSEPRYVCASDVYVRALLEDSFWSG